MPLLASALFVGLTACQDDSDSSAASASSAPATGSQSGKPSDKPSDKPSGKSSGQPSGGGKVTPADLTAALLGDGEIPGDYEIDSTNEEFADASGNSLEEETCRVLIDDPAHGATKANREYAPKSTATATEELPDISLMLIHRPHADHLKWIAELQESYQACERFTVTSADGKAYEFETGHEDYDMYGPDSFEYRMTVTHDGVDIEYLFDYVFVGDYAIVTRAEFTDGALLPTSKALNEVIKGQIGKLGELDG